MKNVFARSNARADRVRPGSVIHSPSGNISLADVLLRIKILALLIALTLYCTAPVDSVLASAPSAPPAQNPTPPPPPPPTGDGDPITQIINQIIEFPFQNLVEALQNAAKSILTGTVTPLEAFFSASIARWLTASPGIITPGGGLADGGDVMGPAWRLMVKVAVLLWPLTLAIIAAIAAKDAVAAASWGIGDMKEALGGWLIAVVASATSLYWMDLTNRFTNATTMTILNMSFTGEAGFQPNALTALVFGTAGILLTVVSMPASLIIVVFVILMGLVVLSALIFQFLARYVILYILVALAPVVIILGVLPPVGWFRYMWLRGFVLVQVIGPINALLLKLVMILAVRGPSNDPIRAFVNFIGAIGVLSVLLTIDGIIIKGVFGAAQEVMQKAVSTVAALGTLALAGVTALAGGSIAAGAAGAASASASGGLGSGGTGGPGSIDGLSGGLAGAGLRGPSNGGGGPASVARRAFDPSAAIRSAGEVLFRQPGMLGSLGAAARSLGNTMERRQRAEQAESHWSADTTSGAQPSGNNHPKDSVGKTRAASGSTPNKDVSNIDKTGKPGTVAFGGPSMSTGDVGIGSPTRGPSPASPSSSPLVAAAHSGDRKAGAAESVRAIPPTQTPSTSPMGAALSGSGDDLASSIPGMQLHQESASVLGLLPTSLGERAGQLGASYSDPREQATSARAAVDAFNQLNDRGRGYADESWQAGAWDRSMAPVLASARQGLALDTMAQDAGFGGNPGGFLAQRMLDAERSDPSLIAHTHPVAWHPQLAPHDWDSGAAISDALSNRLSAGAAARVYHEIRSPETGQGWSAGEQFIQTVREIFQQPPSDPIATLNVRLAEMESRGIISQRAMTLWRANAKS